MKNKIFYASLFMLFVASLSSCAGSRSYGGHKKGYGCPNSSFVKPVMLPSQSAV